MAAELEDGGIGRDFPEEGVGLGGEEWRKEERNGRGWCQLWTSGRSALKIQRRQKDDGG